SLPFKIPKVVQLAARNFAAAGDFDLSDLLGERLEHALHALAMRHLAHGERRVQPAVALGDDHALERLQALAVAFLDLHFHFDRVAGTELRHFLAGHLLGFDRLDDLAHDLLSLCSINSRSSLCCSASNSNPASRSGLFSQVCPRACCSRQRRTASWSPETS